MRKFHAFSARATEPPGQEPPPSRRHARRLALSYLPDPTMVEKLFAEVAPRYADRMGGYTRIVRLGLRKGDAAEVTLPIRPLPPAKKRRSRKNADQAEGHDATWRATVGENITLVPQNKDAANVARASEACGK